jgi:hypothetical protein
MFDKSFAIYIPLKTVDNSQIVKCQGVHKSKVDPDLDDDGSNSSSEIDDDVIRDSGTATLQPIITLNRFADYYLEEETNCQVAAAKKKVEEEAERIRREFVAQEETARQEEANHKAMAAKKKVDEDAAERERMVEEESRRRQEETAAAENQRRHEQANLERQFNQSAPTPPPLQIHTPSPTHWRPAGSHQQHMPPQQQTPSPINQWPAPHPVSHHLQPQIPAVGGHNLNHHQQSQASGSNYYHQHIEHPRHHNYADGNYSSHIFGAPRPSSAFSIDPSFDIDMGQPTGKNLLKIWHATIIRKIQNQKLIQNMIKTIKCNGQF